MIGQSLQIDITTSKGHDNGRFEFNMEESKNTIQKMSKPVA